MSADPLSYTTKGSRVDTVRKCEHLLPLTETKVHSFLWSPGS